MAQAIGVSYLYPALPIANFLAMVSMLLLISTFWKTRIVALVALVGWIFVWNLLYFTGMSCWRGHANDALVLASILSSLARAMNCGLWTSWACFVHFSWQRLQPLPVCQLYDTRRRNNWIHIFFTLMLPLLWMPLHLVSFPARYSIVEDIGPLFTTRQDWPGVLVLFGPQMLGSATVGIFSVLALVSYWRTKREDIDSDILKPHSSMRTRKLLLHAAMNIPLVTYTLCRQIIAAARFEWSPATSLTENIASLQTVFVTARSELDTTFKNSAAIIARTAIFPPLVAFYTFAWFGLGAETRKTYGEALLKLGRPISATLREHWPHVTTRTFSWSATASRRARFRQHLANALSLVLPNAPQITPYTSTILPDDLQVPVSPTRIQASKLVGNRIDVKWQGRVPLREPVRRLSIHKPPLAALNPANTIPPVSDLPLHRLSHHKSPIRQQGEFASHPHARRLSYHKPAFVPLASANAIGAVPDESGPTIPLVEIVRDIIGERNTILQAENVVEGSMAPPPLSSVSPSVAPPPFSTPSIATPAPPYRDVNPFHDHIPLETLNPANPIPSVSEVPLRRVSHHKPRFVPLTPPNAPVTATPGASGSNPLHEAAANDSRRQQQFALRPRARRLSYHKPAFVPLATANAASAAPNGLEPTIPLAEIPRDIIGERDAVLQAEDVVEDSVAPPLVSSVSTPTFAPPYSNPSTATPAPPYREVNPFLVP